MRYPTKFKMKSYIAGRRNLRLAMAGKKNRQRGRDAEGDGMVFSTNPNATFADLFADLRQDDADDSKPDTLYVSLDRKQRAGKPVTAVEGLPEADIKDIGRELRSICGVGGSDKDGMVLIQGDHRDRVVKALEEKGFKVKRKGG
jgi:translation initiation factor 1